MESAPHVNFLMCQVLFYTGPLLVAYNIDPLSMMVIMQNMGMVRTYEQGQCHLYSPHIIERVNTTKPRAVGMFKYATEKPQKPTQF